MAGRAILRWTHEVRYCAKEWASLTGAAAAGRYDLSSCCGPRQQGTTAHKTESLSQPAKALPTRQRLPLWGNGDDRRQRRKQGGAVGAAASRMRGPHQGPKQTLGAATRAVARRRRDGEVIMMQLSLPPPPHGSRARKSSRCRRRRGRE